MLSPYVYKIQNENVMVKSGGYHFNQISKVDITRVNLKFTVLPYGMMRRL